MFFFLLGPRGKGSARSREQRHQETAARGRLLPLGASDGGPAPLGPHSTPQWGWLGGGTGDGARGLSPRLVWLSRIRKDPLWLPGRSSSSSAFCRLTPSYSHLRRQRALGGRSPGCAGTPSTPGSVLPQLWQRGQLAVQQHTSWGHPGTPCCLPEPQRCSTAQREKRGRTSQRDGWSLASGLARVSAMGPCPLGPTLGQTLPSIYLCLTLATQLLGTWHSLPDTSDTTSHHSPSLQGRGRSHPEGPRLPGTGRGPPPGWVPPSWPRGLRTGQGCPSCAGTYSERTRSCSPILRTTAAPAPEGKSQRARKLLGAAGKVSGLRAPPAPASPGWGGRTG